MAKSIKVSEEAHKALEMAKSNEGLKIGEYATDLILKAIKKDYPDSFKAMTTYFRKAKKGG